MSAFKQQTSESGTVSDGIMQNANSERIKWLERAYSIIREEKIPEAPEVANITFGWPTKNGIRGRKIRLGECSYNLKDAPSGVLITISPRNFHNQIEVLRVLAHEMIHAAGAKSHRGQFITIAKRVGFIKPWTSTPMADELKSYFEITAQRLGAYPSGHIEFEAVIREAAGSRLRLWICGCSNPVKVRVASDDFQATCNRCNCAFKRTDSQPRE